jgi:hypothetical protein
MVARHMNATLFAAHHRRRFAGGIVRAGGCWPGNAPPQPERASNDGQQEQQAEQTHNALFFLIGWQFS